jgi:protein-L-isoaspartate(D-aspartate) O-methyltransferase
MTADTGSLRLALVEELCRRGLIRSPAVRDAFSRVPRERFVPEVVEQRGLAAVYRDEALVTRHSPQGVAISSSSQPAIMAAMLESLDLAPGLRVLEIGAGTGYNAALLAELGGQVVALDVDAELADLARRRLADGGAGVEVAVGDGMEGWPQGAPYDRIIVTATPPSIPAVWRDQLREGGLLEVPMLLGYEHAVVHLVVTFRRAGAELASVAMVPGGFMGFRGPDGRAPDYPRPKLGWYDSSAGRHQGGSLYGPGPGRLSAAARRRLLGALLAGPRRTPTGRGADSGLPLALVCWAPAHRLTAVLAGEDQRLGLVDGHGSLAVLLSRWSRTRPLTVLGMERYGDPGEAERELRRVVDEWRARGRPALADFRLRVTFGRAPRGASWRLPSAGEARIGVSLAPPRA